MGLYSLGPFYPATAESISESPWEDNDWGIELSFSAAGGGPYVTASTYDLDDQTYVLKGYNFPGLTGVPTAATIVGIQANLSANFFAGATAPKLDLAQLLTNQRVKGGTNMVSASLPDLSAGTATNYRIGAYNDMWGNALSAAWVRHSGFGVAFGVSAKANNTQVSADTCTLTVWYTTPDSYTVTNNGAVLIVEPQVGSSFAGAGAPVDHPYTGSVEAIVTSKSYIYVFKMLDLGYNQVEVASDGVYAYAAAGAATDYPYTGVVQAVSEVNSERSKVKVLGGEAVAVAVADSERSKVKIPAVAVEAKAVADYDRVTVRARDGSAETEVIAAYDRSIGLSRDAYVEAIAAADSDRGKTKNYSAYAESVVVTNGVYTYTPVAGATDYPYTGSVEAIATSKPDIYVLKNLDLGYNQVEVASDGVYAYAPAGGATAHPYTGVVQAGVETSADRAIGRKRDGSAEAIAAADSDRGKTKNYPAVAAAVVVTEYASLKTKSYDGTAECEAATDTVLLKTKTYAGASSAVAETAYDTFKAKIYKGDTYTVVEIGGVYASTVSIAKDYSGDAASVIESAGEYVSSLATTKTYIGTAEIMAESSVDVARGRAYEQGSSLVVVVAGDSTKSLVATNLYSGQILVTVTPDYSRSRDWNRSGTVSIVANIDGQYRFLERVQETLPVTVWTMEGKPSDGYSLEAVPTRPGSIDGAYTEGTQDGVWDEYPVDGAYTYIGYFKEFKPFHRYTMTKEAVPEVEYIAYLADGTYTADGTLLAGGNLAGRSTEGKPR